MAFNFGAPAPAPAPGAPSPAPATGTGTSTFGTTPAPSAAPGGFSFAAAPTGGTTAAPAPGLFSLGAPAAAAPGAPAPAPGAPAPSPGGFSLGSTPAPGGTASTTTPSPATGAFASAPAPPAAAPATGAFSFATSATATSTTASTGAQPINGDAMTIPEFQSVFPNLSILSKVGRILPQLSTDSDEGALAGQELIHILQCQPSTTDKSVVGHILSRPRPLSWVARNDAFRNKLQTNPTVKLHGKEAVVTPEMMKEIWQLADDLRISEQDAMTVYAAASDPEMRKWLETRLDGSFVDAASKKGSALTAPLVLGNNVPKAARELFFYERGSALTVLLSLVQDRIEACTAATNTPNALLVATDQLIQDNLVENLVSLVREWTRLADDLEKERAQKKAASTSTPMFGVTPTSSSSKEAEDFTTVLLSFAHKQRQLAAECLFYLTYHTQCTAMEVALLVDLIREVTNGRDESSGLPILDPFSDVPSAFLNPDPVPTSTGLWSAPFTAPLPPLKEKDPLAWQHELVRDVWETGGKPQLLKCVSVLVMSVISALDARHVLMDRDLHGPNEFGMGNALLPPSSDTEPGSTDELLPIHERLDPKTESNKDWRRTDIWGLLASAYALLLLPVETVVSSPRGRRGSWSSSSDSPLSPRRGRIDVKATWRACLEAPTQMKSFTFARVSLMPSFERHSVSPDGKCDNYEFYLSVLSEFISQYLDVLCASGNVPISRDQWKSDEETELQVQRVQQEQQRQFRAWSGTAATTEEVIPTEVDLMKRPDCIDDIIALAVAVCSTGPDYAINFWSVTDEVITEGDDVNRRPELVPSRALKTLKRLQTKDASLLPAYLSFLAALALANAPEENQDCSGAAVVHRLLSKAPDLSGDCTRIVNWSTLLHVVRWYARELSASVTGSRGSTDTLRSSSSGTTFDSSSTAYYYGAGDDVAGFPPSQSQQRTSTTTSTTDSKPKELGFTNTVILLSHLRVISTVASNSSVARSAIALMKLPVGDGVGEDPLLTVLFSLAIAPLSPEVRGAAFITISNVLRSTEPREEEKQAVMDMARKGWDLLEESQVLPIALLDQYSPHRGRSGGGVAGIGFPPSSTAQVATKAEAQYATPWSPPDSKYGIIFEMEHVESRMGFYPSTEGLLHLLTTLVSVGGCPSDLGRFWRARSGCAPYIEYAIHFVLPRAMGTQKNDGGLPFRTLGDKSRLVSLALELVEAVISRYVVPSSIGPLASPQPTGIVNVTASTRQSGRELFGLSSVAESCVTCPSVADQKDFALDFKDDMVAVQSSSGFFPTSSGIDRLNTGALSSSDSRAMIAGPGEGSFPRPKSPGFAVLVDLLSSFSGDLFKAAASIISENYASRGINAMYGLPEYEAIVAGALFGATPPTFSSARTTSRNKLPSVTRHSLLNSPLPAAEQASFLAANGHGYAGTTHGIFWRERSIILALRVLCAAAVREEKFARAVNAVSTPLKIVPVLRFHKLGGAAAGIHVYDVQVSRLADLLGSSAGTWVPSDTRVGLLPTTVQYIGYVSSSWRQDADIASSAVALVVYINKVLPMMDCIQSLCGSMHGGDKRVAAAMARRLKVSCNRVDFPPHADMVRVILDMMLFNLRTSSVGNINISDLMLGLPTPATGANWKQPIVGGTNDCFDVLLHLLSDVDFALNNHTSCFAAKCYEIIYRLTCTQNVSKSLSLAKVLYASERLRTIDFWRSNLLLFLGKGGGRSILQAVASGPSAHNGDENVLHCIAWLLKGVSNELRLLMGISPSSKNGSLSSRILALAAPRPSQCRKLLSLLFAGPDFLAVHAFNDVPLERDSQITSTALPSTELIKSATTPLPGPTEVAGGYNIISIDVLLQKMGTNGKGTLSETQKSTLAWAKEWNAIVARDCAVSHFADSLRVVLGSSFIFCRPLLLNGFWDENAYQRAPLEGEGIVQLLSLVLTRLADEIPQVSNARGTEDSLYSSAALQLTMVVLILVQEISGLKDKSQLSLAEGDAVRIYVLLTKAVASSAGGAGFQATKKEERIALLGSSLALLIESLFKGFEGLQPHEEVRETLVLAASALASLSCGAVGGSSRTDWTARGEYRAALARTARSSLSSLFRCHDNGASGREDSFAFQVLTSQNVIGGAANSTLSSFMALVATLDDDIYSLLSQIALCQFGTEILQDVGLPASLISAAQRYYSEEERVQAQVEARHQKVQISTPSFLPGHLSLLNIMLSTTSLSPDRREKLVADAKEVIRHHASTIKRMILSFPTDGDVTLEFARCMYLIASSSPSDKLHGKQNLWHPRAVESRNLPEDRIWIDVERGVLDLTYQISHFPFPRRFLPLLPHTLKSAGTARDRQQHVVSLSTTESQTWWDAVEGGLIATKRIELPDPPTGLLHVGVWHKDIFQTSKDSNANERWSDQHYEFCTQSAEILENSLSFLNCRVLLSPSPPIDFVALAKGFCRCAEAARAIEGRLRLSAENANGGNITQAMSKMDMMDMGERSNTTAMSQLEKEYLVVLGPLLGRCAEKFLVLVLSYLRAVARDSAGSSGPLDVSLQSKISVSDLSAIMLAALDHTEVESMGIGCIGWQTGDENSRDFAMQISKSLRKELQGEMKRSS